jgi:hypothetical protein
MRRRSSISIALWAGVALTGCNAHPAPRAGGSPSDVPDAAGEPPDVAPPRDAAARPADSAASEPDASIEPDAAISIDAPAAPGADGPAGEVLWQNEGTISPWGHLLKDPGCSLTEVSSPTYRGDKALKHVVSFPGTIKLSVHCEVARDPVGMQGDDLYYGWAFMLGDDWPDSYDRKSVISQMTARGRCWNQLDFFTLDGNQHLTDQSGGGPDSCNPGPGAGHVAIADRVTVNVWHRLVLHKAWRGDSTGLVEIWFDGVKTASARDVATGWGDLTTGYAWHVGVYAGLDADRLGSRTIYTDHYRVARTYQAADPASW